MNENIEDDSQESNVDNIAINRLFTCLKDAGEKLLSKHRMSCGDYLNGICKYTSFAIMNVNKDESNIREIALEFSTRLMYMIDVVIEKKKKKNDE
jgi:hypothetical protein